jgi:hypothetical protein
MSLLDNLVTRGHTELFVGGGGGLPETVTTSMLST